jgi:hypothetical protein
MMDSFWNSRGGKLVLGGCGAQVGMVFGLGVLAVIGLLCVICISFNVLSISLTQQISDGEPSPDAPIEVSSPSEEANLLAEINYLLGEIDLLLTGEPTEPTALEAAPPSVLTPVVVADQSGVDLYSGPGVDYDKAGVLSPGGSLSVVGRNNEATWWLVAVPNGLFAWVPDVAVAAFNINETIPVVTMPSLLAQPAGAASSSASSDEPIATVASAATATPVPTPTPPVGTPTAVADQERFSMESMGSYQRVKRHLMVPPVSASISPDGTQIAITERIKMYTVVADGAHTDIWFEDDADMGPIGGVVWSPDGRHLAFVIGFKQKYCKPCRAVALLRMSDKTITLLKPPGDMDTDAPRWTQDGRLLVNAHPGEPADGVAYIYNVFGESQVAVGTYQLSASHEGQKWFPWRPGRVWRAGVSERADSYNSD